MVYLAVYLFLEVEFTAGAPFAKADSYGLRYVPKSVSGRSFRTGRPADCIRRGGASYKKGGFVWAVGMCGRPALERSFRTGRPAACVRRRGALPTEERPRDWLWLSVNRLWTGAAVYQAANQRDKHAEHSAQYQAKSEDHRLLWLNGVG